MRQNIRFPVHENRDSPSLALIVHVRVSSNVPGLSRRSRGGKYLWFLVIFPMHCRSIVDLSLGDRIRVCEFIASYTRAELVKC